MTINKKISAFNFSNRNGTGIKYIVIHDTGVKGQTAKNNVDYFAGGDRNASAHYFVDENSVWQSVEEANTSWHCGDGGGKYGITNLNSIGIEMCPTATGIPETTQNLCINLINELQAKYGVGVSNVVRHYDASRKNCPAHLNLDGKWTAWNAFKAKLAGTSTTTNTSTTSQIGYLDAFYQSADLKTLDISGWHNSDKVGKYRYIFLMDYATDKELARVESPLVSRPDVKKVYPHANTNTGFSGRITIPDSAKGKKVYILVRYTDDKAGNAPIADFFFRDKPITLKTNSTPTEKVGRCTANGVNVRKSASISSQVVRMLDKGNLFNILDYEGEWVKVNIVGTVGYVHKNYVG